MTFYFAGFDRRDPPGRPQPLIPLQPSHLALMQRLVESGSFSWAGYYLAPTNAIPGKSQGWMGTREILTEQGWNLVPLYWGYQVNYNDVASWTTEAEARQHGREDSLDAAQLARAEGFADGTAIFLDVEPEEGLPTPPVPAPTKILYAAYVDEWFATLWGALGQGPNDTQYHPAFYGHVRDIIGNAYSARVRDADRWLCGGRSAITSGNKNDSQLLDAWGWPLTKDPYDAGRPCNVWQWAQDVTLSSTNAGYSFSDYDGVVHQIPDGLDYDSSVESDPARSGGKGINEVIAVKVENQHSSIVGGRDSLVRVYLGRPAARPLGVDVEVTDGKHTKRGHVEPGQSEVVVAVPTDPVDVDTYVTYSARLAWWRFSREHAGMTASNEPPPKTATDTVSPPKVVEFFITPKVAVGQTGTGTIVLEEIPTLTYRVQLSDTEEYDGKLMLEGVPAEVGFTGKETTFEFKGGSGPPGGGSTWVELHSVVESTGAWTMVFK